MLRYGIINPDGSVRAAHLLEWAMWFQTAGIESYKEGGRQVARTELPDGTYVSTVFIGMNMSYGDGAPEWFETMIFGGPHDSECWRCSTFEEAETDHARAVELAQQPPTPTAPC